MRDRLMKKFGSLPEEIQPDRDLWPEIAAQLQPSVAPKRSYWPWPAALAASLALVAVTAAVTWRIATPVAQGISPEQALASLIQIDSAARFSPTPEFISTRTELIRAFEANWSRLPPASQEIVADNLLEIRSSLAAIEAALSEDPDNASLQRLLHTTYEQELEVLVTLYRASESLPVEVEI